MGNDSAALATPIFEGVDTSANDADTTAAFWAVDVKKERLSKDSLSAWAESTMAVRSEVRRAPGTDVWKADAPLKIAEAVTAALSPSNLMVLTKRRMSH